MNGSGSLTCEEGSEWYAAKKAQKSRLDHPQSSLVLHEMFLQAMSPMQRRLELRTPSYITLQSRLVVDGFIAPVFRLVVKQTDTFCWKR